jgi:hypothetical protein
MSQSTHDEADDRWRGIEIELTSDVNTARMYRVDFYPRRPMSDRKPGESGPRVPREASVKVLPGPEPQVFTYVEPEIPSPHLTRKDYEAKALEMVREEIRQG